MVLLHNFFLILIGLAGGLAVGGGFVAFITVLDLIPRLIHLAKAARYILIIEYAIILGVLVSTWVDFRDWTFTLPNWLTAPLGFIMGTFVGMLAAALTEVLNVYPLLIKRLKMQNVLLYFLMAVALGKVTGSLLQWVLLFI